MNTDVISIATNQYIDYWAKMITSFDSAIDQSTTVTSYIFTDNLDKAELVGRKLHNIKVAAILIPAYGWPEATLLRYQIFYNHAKRFTGDVILYLDADMLVNQNPIPRIERLLTKNTVVLVRHPGYWTPTLFQIVRNFDVSNLYRYIRKKIFGRFRGSWESNQISTAYVPQKNRKSYVCGGVWFGQNKEIIELLRTLSIRVQDDYKEGIIATWHDESHLNNWSTKNKHGEADPDLCFVNEYEYLRKFSPIITAVTKETRTR